MAKHHFFQNTLKDQEALESHRITIRVGNGVSTSFWHDQWLRETCLSEIYPRIYSLATQKFSSIHELWNKQHGWAIILQKKLY